MGCLADRLGARRLLFLGYTVFGAISILFAIGTTSIPLAPGGSHRSPR